MQRLILCLPFCWATTQGYTQNTAHLERAIEGVGLEPKLGAQVPAGIELVGSTGRTVVLDSLLERPTLLTFVYHSCPMLCSVVLDGLTRALESVPWTPGHEYNLVTVSIDPEDTPALAATQRERYLRRVDREDANWLFLTGEEAVVRDLARSVGFHYAWVEDQQEYAHPAALIFLSPGGTVTRYLPDVAPRGRDVRASLVEASEGTIGSLLDRVFLFCFQYDPTSNSYVLAATRAMRVGGLFAAVMLIGFLTFLWRREFVRQEPTA